MNRWQTALFILVMLLIAVAMSYSFAQLGEPQAVWLWSFWE